MGFGSLGGGTKAYYYYGSVVMDVHKSPYVTEFRFNAKRDLGGI
jgi:hypothetical protein